MKILVRLGIATFGLLSIISFTISLTLVRDIYTQVTGEEAARPSYHFSLYLPDNRNSFFLEIINGAEKAAAEVGAVLSIHSIDPYLSELEMASYTGVDGVVVCPYLDDRLARRQLEKLTAKQIPVVLINHNVPNDQPWPFIGTNNFDVGRKLGTIAGRIVPGAVNLAVVYSDKAPGIAGERELVEMGIASALAGRMAAPIMGLRTSRNPLDAEEIIIGLFRSSPQVNTIIFTDANDTVAAAQALIDMNLVGRVQLIGFGDDPMIIEYIRKGIIAGTIAVNPERIGYEAVQSLFSLRTTGYTSTSIDTGVSIIDRISL